MFFHQLVFLLFQSKKDVQLILKYANQSFSRQSLKNDPFPPAFNNFWENVKAIVQPYWYPTEPGERAFSDVIRAWGMLILLILLIIVLVGVTAFNSFVTRYLADIIIQEKDYL